MTLDIPTFYATPVASGSGTGTGVVRNFIDYRGEPDGPIPATTNGPGVYDPFPLTDQEPFGGGFVQAAEVVDGAVRVRDVPGQLNVGVILLHVDGGFASLGHLISGRMSAKLGDWQENPATTWTASLNIEVLTLAGVGYQVVLERGGDGTGIYAASLSLGFLPGDGSTTPIDSQVLPYDDVCVPALGWDSAGHLVAYADGLAIASGTVGAGDRPNAADLAAVSTILHINIGEYADVSPAITWAQLAA